MTERERRPSITFYYSGSTAEREALEPVAEEATRRGYEARFSTDLSERNEIGIYNTHVYPDDTVNATNSAIMANSVDDGYEAEYFWRERWNRFDVGLLAGEASSENWRSVAWNRYARPSNGVYDVGWPKSDWVYTDEFARLIETEREELGLTGGHSVIYAPAEESAGKMHDFLSAADGLVDTLLIKHKGSEDYSDVRDTDYDSDLLILDSSRGIFEALGLADLLVSETSSVIPEALHTGTIPVSVTDWPVNFSSGTRYPGSDLPEFVETTTRDQLGSTIEAFCRGELNLDFERVRERHFSNIGRSASVTMDVIEAVLVEGDDHPSRVEPAVDGSTVPISERGYSYARVNLEKRLSPESKERLLDLGVSKLLMKLDRVFLDR